METIKFVQKAKVGAAGSFINQLMANNASIPQVGKGATILQFTDRTCCEVVKVSEDCKTVRLETLAAIADKTKQLGVGHQNWILEPTGQYFTVVWRNKGWKVMSKSIVFTKEFREKVQQAKGNLLPCHFLTQAQNDEIYQGEAFPQKVVKGITRQNTKYRKINILFGVKDYYYDWEF